MKVDKRPLRWDHEPWTIIRECSGDRENAADLFYAFNTRTGERKPVRYSYEVAFEDIPVNGQMGS